MSDCNLATRSAMLGSSREPPLHTKPRLPYEILDNIFGQLQKALSLKTLAGFVQLNKACYDLGIPRLYETIIATKDNQKHLTYGLTPVRSKRDVPSAIRTRKDIAKSFTRKIIADTAPLSQDLIHFYRDVTDVVVTAKCHDMLMPPVGQVNEGSGQYPLQSSEVEPVALPPLIHASVDHFALLLKYRSSTTLHVDIEVSTVGFRKLHEVASHPESLSTILNPCCPITYGFFAMPIETGSSSALQTAYAFWGVVQFADPNENTLGQYAMTLSDMVCGCLRSETVAPGRLFLCDIPRLVLSKEELVKAGAQAKEIALIKIYDAWPAFCPRPKWDVFSLRVQLVDRGYRRSEEEHLKDMGNFARIDPSTLQLIKPTP